MKVSIGGSGKFICAGCNELLPICHTDDGKTYLSHSAMNKHCPNAGKRFELPVVEVPEIVEPKIEKAGSRK